MYVRKMIEQFRPPALLGNLFFSVEAHFYVEGYMNKQNMGYCQIKILRNFIKSHCIAQKRIFFGRPPNWTSEWYCTMVDDFLSRSSKLLMDMTTAPIFSKMEPLRARLQCFWTKRRGYFPEKWSDIPGVVTYLGPRDHRV